MCQISPDTEKGTRDEELVDQCDAVSGVSFWGEMLCSPAVWIKVAEFLMEFCKHLVKKLVADNAGVDKGLTGQVSIWQ